MIKGKCYTNLDDYKYEEWPTRFVAVPRIGERVEARSGQVLKVCSVTHTISETAYSYVVDPHIKVELTKTASTE